MYFIDMYILYNLIHKYNITLNVAVKEDRVTGKFNYYTGFKT